MSSSLNPLQAAGALRSLCTELVASIRQHQPAGTTREHMLAIVARLLQEYDAHVEHLAVIEERVLRQSAIIDEIHDSVITMDLEGFITGWNRGAERLFGYSETEMVGRHILFLYADEQDEDIPFDRFLQGGEREFTIRRRKKSGEAFWASITLSLVRDQDDQPTGMVGYLIDITDKLAAEEKLLLHSVIFEQASEAVIITDADLRIVSVNRAFTAITGFTEDMVLNQIPALLAPRSNEPTLMEELRQKITVAGGGHWQGELWDRRVDGDTYPAWVSISSVRNRDGQITHHLLILSDMTERKEAERQIYRLVHYDSLTGLPNRSLFHALLTQSIEEARRRQEHGAVMLLKLNRFRHINDSLGHDIADQLLSEVANRLRNSLRAEDIIARHSGVDFTIALFDIAKREHAALVAQKLLDTLDVPFQVDGHDISLTTSVGVAIYPDDGRDADTLIVKAGIALTDARHATHPIVFYSPEMNRRSLDRLRLEADLKRAIAREELQLYYQAQYDLGSGDLIGAEALIRWERPGHGMVSPAAFIPIAEETGMIAIIGDWVLREACRQCEAWLQEELPLPRIAINLSARQVRPSLVQTLEEVLASYQVPPTCLELELTESLLLDQAEQVIRIMEACRATGVMIALDDFGTGYSSLAYLARLPMDKVKIDQSFVAGLPHDPRAAAITHAIIGMAHSLGLRTLAEGIETSEQRDFLISAGCDEAQGYLYSRPIPAMAMTELLHSMKR